MTAVTVTRYKAKDGSLHDSQSIADWHDECSQRERRVYAVSSAIRDDVISFFSYRFNKCYDNMDDWDVKYAIEQLAEICIKHASEIQSGANKK